MKRKEAKTPLVIGDVYQLKLPAMGFNGTVTIDFVGESILRDDDHIRISLDTGTTVEPIYKKKFLELYKRLNNGSKI